MFFNLISFIIDFLFVENAIDLFEIYVNIVVILTIYSISYVFKIARDAKNEIKKFVSSSLLLLKDFIDNSIDNCVNKLL